MFDDCIPKKLLGILSLIGVNWRPDFCRFNHCARVDLTGKRLNRGAGFGLEIPLDYIFTETLEQQLGLRKLWRN